MPSPPLPARALRLAAASCLVVGLGSAAVALAAPRLFPCRVPYPPLLEKLEASGGDLRKVIVIHGLEDLAVLKPSRRYKFVVRAGGQVAVAPRPLDEKGNEYVHPILAGGEPVRTAGTLHVEHRGAHAEDELIFADQDSKAYCPTFESLVELRAALARVDLRRDRVRLEDHPPTCAPLPGPPDAGP